MRIPINLASEPLENLRPVRSAVALATLAALMLGGVILNREWHSRNEFHALIEQQTELESKLAALDAQQKELESWLSTPQAQQVRQRSGFLNSLILHKSLSWTQLFMDLEKTLPPRVRITSIQPKLDASENADLTLSVSATTMEPLVQFLKNLESSPQFGSPVVGAQHFASEKNAGGEISLDLTTRYLQSRSKNAAEQPDTSAAPADSELALGSRQERR